MTDKVFENNQVSIVGEVISEFGYSHEVFGESFYMVELSVNRLSDSNDVIPVMVSERLLDVTQSYVGQFAHIQGQFRSYNRHEENRNRLVLSVFAREICLEDEPDENVKPNYIFLDGYVCKPPIYRKTPLGREIADVLLAVNRPYGKSDYIPSICWGRNARYCQQLNVGDGLHIEGRLQSRDYQKKLDDETVITKTAYEVSVSKLYVNKEDIEEFEDEIE
jgi:single-stranded DNA-binding protein